MSKVCWIRSTKGLHGPYDPGLLGKLAESGLLKPDMEISTNGQDWHRAETLPGLFANTQTQAPVQSLRPAAPESVETAPGTAPRSSIADRIDALPVSDRWKQHFHELEANPEVRRLNIPAFLFGQFYYLAKGMWKKALALTMWLTLSFLIVAVGTAALGYSIPDKFAVVVTAAVFGTLANRDYWRKAVHRETFWPGATARWAAWLSIPALVAALILVFAFTPRWLSLPTCDQSDAGREILRLVRESGPMQLDGHSWHAERLTDIFELGRRPLPEFRHCHARLHLRTTAGEKHSYSIEYWIYFDKQGELRIAIN